MSKRILVVDDEESIRYTFENFLSEGGHNVQTACNFNEALEKLSDGDFDLIFADIILGGSSGIDLLKEIRSRNLICPVVMITGYPNIETASEAVRLGAFDYISKPVRPDTLLHAATMALQHKALQQENEQYRSNLEAIFRSVKDGIITVDRNLTVLELNQAALDICQVDRGKIGASFSLIQGDCKGQCLPVLEKTINTAKPVEALRTECKKRGKENQVVSISASPLLDKNGMFTGAVMVIRDETRLNDLERNLRERRRFQNIIGQNEKMQGLYNLIDDLADVQTTVLITGESGTGKELVAEAIHYSGERSNRPLVKVNCSALPESLLENELFGHVKGAFTGADRDKTGRFQKADGGTIFLDEIGDISHRVQLRLLRVLQEKSFERVGDSTPLQVDVRIIAATNQDLKMKVRSGEFREDLYFRLKVVELMIPPLRDRKDDIPLLIGYFLQKFNNKLNRRIETVSEEVLKIFMNYEWPGNVRELEHALEHAFILCRLNTITVDHLPESFRALQAPESSSQTDSELEPRTIAEALKKAGWNKSKAARMLGVNVRTIYRKIEKYNIRPDGP